MSTKARATVEDLYRMPEDGKAELINGEVVQMSPTGDDPNRAAGSIYISLRQYERLAPGGWAYTDNAAFTVRLSNRGSLSPDAAFYRGERTGLKFLRGAPVFAVEVRSEGDYGTAAEQAMAAKRADYFKAGTLVVWDVDLIGEAVVRVYRKNAPEQPTIYRRGERAEAEPALPGWSMPVDDLFA